MTGSLFLTGDAATSSILKQVDLPRIEITSPRLMADIEMMASGGYKPLDFFVGIDSYCKIISNMRMSGGALFPIPIVFPVRERVKPNTEWALSYQGQLFGILKVSGVFKRDLVQEAICVYGTQDRRHPGVAALFEEGERCAGGHVVITNSTFFTHEKPSTVRAIRDKRNWDTMVAFQTRNPMHMGHEYITKCALETVDGLLLHPLVGQTKDDDIPADTRMRSYRALVDHYYPEHRVILAGYPAPMRYAGPREALLHMITRKNYGATHIIIGRDHAGVGDYYEPYAAQKLCQQHADEIGITPLCFEEAHYCFTCKQVATPKTCRHTENVIDRMSGTRMRQWLKEGFDPPAWVRPEVAAELRYNVTGGADEKPR